MPALLPEDALLWVGRTEAQPWRDAAQALARELDTRSAPRTHAWPAGLTDREVEVLRHAARDLSRREIAETLVVSESTVRSHIEHIYAKLGVSTRVGAVMFAMENDLLP